VGFCLRCKTSQTLALLPAAFHGNQNAEAFLSNFGRNHPLEFRGQAAR
jgi:hypothetical protein